MIAEGTRSVDRRRELMVYRAGAAARGGSRPLHNKLRTLALEFLMVGRRRPWRYPIHRNGGRDTDML